MSIIGSNILAGAAGQGGDYTIEESLRFNASQSSYLNWTPASAGNRKTWTWSGWVKRGNLSNGYSFLATTNTSTPRTFFGIDSDSLWLLDQPSGVNASLTSTAKFRDPSAWYHVVLSVDTTQATSTNRVKMYVNGVQQTISGTYPTQNTDMEINKNVAHTTGSYDTNYFDGYITEVNFIDGQALDPSSFGEYNADTGVWQPVKYAGTYGTNGFFLDFSDATSATTLGYDYSGQSNNWTLNNFNTTSTSTAYCSMTDTPTPYLGGGNYAVLNPLSKNSAAVIKEANLVNDTTGYGFTQSTVIPQSGKWYAEFNVSGAITTSGWGFGVIAGNVSPVTLRPGSGGATGYWYAYSGSASANNASWFNEGTQLSPRPIPTIGTTAYKVAIDVDSGYIWLGDSSNWYDSSGGTTGNPATGANPTFTVSSISTRGGLSFACGNYAAGSSWISNFGQRPFAYTPPTGFLPLHTGNLPDSNIVDGSKHFDVVTFTGNGTTQSITGLEFQPDFIWGKSRSAASSHRLLDAIRGTELVLYSDTTDPEGTEATALTSFNSDGYTMAGGSLNPNTVTMVDWVWKAGGTGVTNTDGSITSTVSANPTAGFSVVTLTAQSSGTGTFGHGLGVAPSMVITKLRALANAWATWHISIPNTQYLELNTTNGAQTAASYWNSTSPTSTVVSLGSAWAGAGTMVAYCFAEVESYSKFGSYVGNGSSDGPFVYCGFRPKFLLGKASSTTSQWFIWDTERNTYNALGDILYPNLSAAEVASALDVDFLSNGFKFREGGGAGNDSGVTYIYMAFAENPFKNSLAR